MYEQLTHEPIGVVVLGQGSIHHHLCGEFSEGHIQLICIAEGGCEVRTCGPAVPCIEEAAHQDYLAPCPLNGFPVTTQALTNFHCTIEDEHSKGNAMQGSQCEDRAFTVYSIGFISEG